MSHVYIPLGTLEPFEATDEALDTFYVYHKDRIVDLYRKWCMLLPTVEAFYAIKCNPAPVLLDALAECGAAFDAASPAEIEAALIRVPASKVIYANPCKTPRDIGYAIKKSIGLTTFDNQHEYDKIVAASACMDMLLRIYATDTSAKCVLSNKYGALPNEWQPILEYIAEKGGVGRVIGVSFHIGSGANDPAAFTRAIAAASDVFGVAARLGYMFSVLDIGGGFSHSNIESMATCINDSLEAFQRAYPGTRVIAEPGRYFAETAADLYTKIIGVRSRPDGRHYWINDSIYGSFNCIMYDYARPIPAVLPIGLSSDGDGAMVNSTIWGSTCDGADKIIGDLELPILDTGAWMCWEHMGAYTAAGATTFNGIPFIDIKTICM